MGTILFTVLVILVGTFHGGNGYPTGAPPGQCIAMTPGHYPPTPQTSDPPFLIVPSSSSYSPGSNVSVTILSPCQKTFRGFMLYAMKANSDQNAASAGGTFTTAAYSRTVYCPTGQHVTHNNRSDKTSVSFTWTAPAQAQGHIVFKATLVGVFSTFWSNVYSPVVYQSNLQAAVNPGTNVYPTANSCPVNITRRPSPTATTTARNMPTTTSQPSSSAKPKLSKDLECGKSKGCAFKCSPLDDSKCTTLITWFYDVSSAYIRFEMMSIGNESNRWMAMGLSMDLKMGNDSVTECVHFNGRISVYSSYNFNDSKSNSRLKDVNYGVTKVSGKMVDGVFRCTFDRQIRGQDDFFGLSDSYTILFATGSTWDFSDEKKMHFARPERTSSSVNFMDRGEYAFDVFAGAQTNTMGTRAFLLLILAWVLKTML